MRELDALEFERLLSATKPHVLVDVREPHEVKQGKISGAMNIPLGQLANRTQEISQGQPIFIYCRSACAADKRLEFSFPKDFKM